MRSIVDLSYFLSFAFLVVDSVAVGNHSVVNMAGCSPRLDLHLGTDSY